MMHCKRLYIYAVYIHSVASGLVLLVVGLHISFHAYCVKASVKCNHIEL